MKKKRKATKRHLSNSFFYSSAPLSHFSWDIHFSPYIPLVVWNERWLVSRLISSLRSPEFSKQTKIRGLLPASVARLCIHMWKRRIRGIQWCWSHQNRRILSDLNLRTFITFFSGILPLFFRPVSGKNLMKNIVRMIFLLEMTLPRCIEGKWIKKLSI